MNIRHFNPTAKPKKGHILKQTVLRCNSKDTTN